MLLANIAMNYTSKGAIKVMDVDMSNYNSVETFTTAARTEVPVVDFLMLNAGLGIIKLERSPTGHENMMRVNYLSNVLLIGELLPHLIVGAERTGTATRVAGSAVEAEFCAEVST
jgi:short-subunit dehydrogenase